MRQLNIENIYKEAIKLTYRDQLILISKLAMSLQKLKSGKKRKLSELKGLGKEIWQNIDADDYLPTYETNGMIEIISIKKIMIDTAPIIYFIEEHEKYFPLIKPIFD